jgi:hypothetical protein
MFKNLTPAEYEVLLRHDFATFAMRCFNDLNPQTRLAMNWHLEVIAAKLTAVREGKIRRLIINRPYTIDFVAIIFHPKEARRPICVSRQHLGGEQNALPGPASGRSMDAGEATQSVVHTKRQWHMSTARSGSPKESGS